MNRINVTKTYLPPIDEYQSYLSRIWETGQITNQGPLLVEFEKAVKQKLEVENIHFVANGTIALQLALKSLDSSDAEIITTPFSYVATTSAILWEGFHPVFVDIDPQTFCIDPHKIEAAITEKTKAILGVHIYGYACDDEKISAIAKKHNLKVIYDGAHAFGAEYKGRPLLGYGDISTCSFHATKPFHTIEGGCVITKDEKVSAKIELMKRFGHNLDDHYMLGINAKATEFQAAMGLCNLKLVDAGISSRKAICELYDELLGATLRRRQSEGNSNYAYYPILLQSETHLHRVIDGLNAENIFPRRYFYPSLNQLPYLSNRQSCPVSEDVSSRVLCLPLYRGLEDATVSKISSIVVSNAA
jgi:dTDP-4-amino-4,6-dideoxygalactose transaminase